MVDRSYALPPVSRYEISAEFIGTVITNMGVSSNQGTGSGAAGTINNQGILHKSNNSTTGGQVIYPLKCVSPSGFNIWQKNFAFGCILIDNNGGSASENSTFALLFGHAGGVSYPRVLTYKSVGVTVANNSGTVTVSATAADGSTQVTQTVTGWNNSDYNMIFGYYDYAAGTFTLWVNGTAATAISTHLPTSDTPSGALFCEISTSNHAGNSISPSMTIRSIMYSHDAY